jgi:phosphoglycolate phosphatase
MMARPEYILWDWNGTLLDDAWTGLVAMNIVLASRGLPLIRDMEVYRGIFCFPVEDYYEKAGLDRALFPVVSHEWMAAYMRSEITCVLRPGAIDILKHVQCAGIKQILVSASEINNLKAQLGRFHLNSYFAKILGLDHIYATGKIGIAREWMASAHVQPQYIILIGDTLHDWEVACDLGCRCILVEGGHQSRRVLLSARCPVADSLSQLIHLLNV